MAGMMKSISTILVAAVVMAAVLQRGEAEITCGAVVTRLNPCLPYVTDKGPIGVGCCEGIKGLHGAAKTTADRQTICGCLKTMAASKSGINFDKVAGLPKQCGVNLPYVISPDTDCSKLK